MGLLAIGTDWTAFVYGSPAPLPAPAPQPFPEPLPPLEEIPCPRCQGVGFMESFDPMLSERCDRCYERKTIEVCGTCKQVPEVRGGREACGCIQ